MNTTIQISTEEFLEDLYDSAEAIIYFNTNGKSWKNKPQTYSDAQPKLEKCNNKWKCDIYYIPNSGGTKDSQISNINSVFIDWDTGKDQSGKYFPIEVVQQKKQEFLQKLSQFHYKPTYIIETRNGFHVYWFLFPGTTSEQFVLIQKQLIKYFDSDPKVCNPARVMRLPGYYASKNGKYSPFLASILEYNSVRYSVDTFISFFSISPLSLSLSSQNQDSDLIDHTPQHPDEVRISAHNNIYINKEYTSNIIMGTKPRSIDGQEPMILDTMEDVVDYLCKQNIAEYWNLAGYEKVHNQKGLTMVCPFHSDERPSSSMYYYKGYCYLKCHSSNCEFGSGTIIKAIEGKDNISESQAVVKLMKYYNIKLDDTWKIKEEEKYIHNTTQISQCNEWKERYPDLYRDVNRINRDLLSKLLFAKDHIQLRTSEGKTLFFCSLIEFERICREDPKIKHQNNQNQKVDRYCLLGLMEKIDKSEIPYGLYRKMQHFKGQKRFKYRMQCYHIPEYTPELLQKADDIGRTAKEKGIKLNSITKNSVRDIFGEEVAKRIYPQVDQIETTESGIELKRSVENVMIEEIDVKGYTTTAEIKKRLMGSQTWKSVHDRRVKEHLPGLLVKHNMVEITANKKLKEQYGIDSKGYPKIIVKQVEKSEKNSSDMTELEKEAAA